MSSSGQRPTLDNVPPKLHPAGLPSTRRKPAEELRRSGDRHSARRQAAGPMKWIGPASPFLGLGRLGAGDPTAPPRDPQKRPRASTPGSALVFVGAAQHRPSRVCPSYAVSTTGHRSERMFETAFLQTLMQKRRSDEPPDQLIAVSIRLRSIATPHCPGVDTPWPIPDISVQIVKICRSVLGVRARWRCDLLGEPRTPTLSERAGPVTSGVRSSSIFSAIARISDRALAD